MSEPYIGEIRMFAGNFAPRGWAFCDGQLIAVGTNDALFSLLGTIYGGDGRTTFGLPDLRGRIPIHAGTGPGLSPRQLGRTGGLESVTGTANALPAHNHRLQASSHEATSKNPRNRVAARAAEPLYASGGSTLAQMHPVSVNNSGGGQNHDNMMPFQCLHFIIALVGIYPSRT